MGLWWAHPGPQTTAPTTWLYSVHGVNNNQFLCSYYLVASITVFAPAILQSAKSLLQESTELSLSTAVVAGKLGPGSPPPEFRAGPPPPPADWVELSVTAHARFGRSAGGHSCQITWIEGELGGHRLVLMVYGGGGGLSLEILEDCVTERFHLLVSLTRIYSLNDPIFPFS